MSKFTDISNKKLSNAIGLVGYGPKFHKDTFLASVGSAILLRIQGKGVIITSRFLIQNISQEYKPKFFFKLLYNDNDIKRLIVDASRDDFCYHVDESNDNSFGFTYIVLKKCLSNFELFELSFGQQFSSIFDAELLNIATTDKDKLSKDDFYNDEEKFEIFSSTGKNFTIRQPLMLSDSNFILREQRRIEIVKNELSTSLCTGGLVYKRERSVEPVGLITTFGNGQSRQFFEGERKRIDCCTYIHLSKLLKAICLNNNLLLRQGYESASSFYIENVQQVRDTIERIIDDIITEKIIEIKNGPLSEVAKNEVNWLLPLKEEFLSSRFNLFLIEQSLLNLDWWKVSHRNDPPERSDKEGLIHAYHKTTFRGFIISIFSVIEHCLRENLRRIDPKACNNGRGNFHNIKGYLFKRLNIEEKELYDKLFLLFRNIRNAIHNDGFHYSKNEGDDLKIEYRNKTYEFVDQKLIPVNWQDLLIIAEDASNFLIAFLEDGLIKESFDVS